MIFRNSRGVLYSQVNQPLIFRPCIHFVTSSDRTKPSRKSLSEVNPPTHHASPLHIQRRAPSQKKSAKIISSWWLNQPLWKIWSSNWVHLPQSWGLKPPPRKGLQRSFSYEVWSRPTHLPPPPKERQQKTRVFFSPAKKTNSIPNKNTECLNRMLDWYHLYSSVKSPSWCWMVGFEVMDGKWPPGSRGKFSGLPIRDLSISSVQGTEIMLIFEILIVLYIEFMYLYLSMYIFIISINQFSKKHLYYILFPTHHFTVLSFWCPFVNCAWSCGLKKSCERQGDPKYAPPSDGRQKRLKKIPMLPTMVSVVSNLYRFVFQKNTQLFETNKRKTKKHILHTLCMVETEPCNKLPKHSLPEWLQKAGFILINCNLKKPSVHHLLSSLLTKNMLGNPTLSNRKGTWKQPSFQENYNTPVEHTPGNPPSPLWKESLYSLLVKV